MMWRQWFSRALWVGCLLGCANSIACGEGEQDAVLDPGDGDSGDGDSGDGDGAPEDCGDLDCGDNGTCVEDEDDGPVCECEDGFSLDDDACVDVDECDDGSDACDANATCENTEGDYECTCNEGFEGDGFVCEEAAEACDPETDEMCEAEGPKCPTGQTGDAEADECYCDLSGYWAMRHDVTLTLPEQKIGQTVFIAESVNKATLWELHRYDYDGTTIKVQKKGCGSDSYPEVLSPAYEETYSSGVPQSVFDDLDLAEGTDIPLAADDALPGKDFTTPMEAAVAGIELDDPLNDPWPATAADVPSDAWVDVEGDGVPGLTLWSAEPDCPQSGRPAPEETICFTPIELETMTTAVSRRASCVSVASRVVTHLEGKIDGCGRLTGEVFNDLTQGRVHSCIQVASGKWDMKQSCTAADWANDDDNVPCTADQVAFLDEQDQTQMSEATFEAIKLGGLDGDFDCDAVRERLPAIERN